jgi:hypothetical protein
MVTRQLANRRLGNCLRQRQAQSMMESQHTTSPHHSVSSGVESHQVEHVCTLPELKQGRVQIQFQIPMMGMLFGKSADASRTNVEQCSSQPVWSLSLCRR